MALPQCVTDFLIYLILERGLNTRDITDKFLVIASYLTAVKTMLQLASAKFDALAKAVAATQQLAQSAINNTTNVTISFPLDKIGICAVLNNMFGDVFDTTGSSTGKSNLLSYKTAQAQAQINVNDQQFDKIDRSIEYINEINSKLNQVNQAVINMGYDPNSAEGRQQAARILRGG